MQQHPSYIGYKRKLMETNDRRQASSHPKDSAQLNTTAQETDVITILSQLSMRLLGIGKTEDLLTDIADGIRKSLPFESVLICLPDESGMNLECRASVGKSSQRFSMLKNQTFSVESFKSIIKDYDMKSRSYYVRTIQPTGESQWSIMENGCFFEKAVVVPIMDGSKKTIGFLVVEGNEGDETPSTELIETLETFANFTGVALKKATMEKEARRRRSYLSNLTENIQDAILHIDMDGTIKSWNKGAEKLYGYRSDDVIGQRMDDILIPPEQKGRLKQIAKKLAEEGGSVESKAFRMGKDGRRFWVMSTCFPYADAEGYFTGLAIIDRDESVRKSLGDELKKTSDSLRDELKIAGRQHLKTLRLLGTVQKENVGLEKLIDKVRRTETELKVSNRKLEELSTMDDLTKLWNRRHLNRKLGEEMKRSNRFKRPLAFIMMDIDRFKEYNDTHGHIPGDAILKELAHLLISNVREIDLVARYGGDEFCILFPETDANEVMGQAERIRELVDKHPFDGQESIPGGTLTVSVGVAVYPQDAQSKITLIEYSDKALYAAKKAGGNRVFRFQSGRKDG